MPFPPAKNTTIPLPVGASAQDYISGDDYNQVAYPLATGSTTSRSLAVRFADVVNVKDYGAKGDGVTDDTAAIQAAITATPSGGTMDLGGGRYKLTSGLTITKPMTVRGNDSRVANVSDLSASNALLNFTTDVVGITVTDSIVSLKSLVINGIGSGTSTWYGVRVTGVNGAILTEDVVVQAFLVGVHITDADYNKLSKTTLTFNKVGLLADGSFNLYASGLTIRTSDVAFSNGIQLTNGSSMTMLGGSIESFQGFGVVAYLASSINLFGVYFEGSTATPTGRCVDLDTGSRVSAVGNHVYMTGAARWISVDSGGTTGVHVYSRNNRIVWPVAPSTQAATGYVFVTDGTEYVDVAGDNWTATPGVNVGYLGGGYAPGKAAQIEYPVDLAASYANRTRMSHGAAGASAITVTASPFTYTNSDGVHEAVYISGGTVSAIAKNAVTLFAASPATVWLAPGEAVTVTYAVAPTMNKDLK